VARPREQELKVKLIGDASQLSSTFRKGSRDADTFGGKMKLLGRSMRQVMQGDFVGAQKSISQMGSKFAVAGAAAVAFAAAVAVAAYKIGQKLYEIGAAWDKAYDTIRIGTGATGDALRKLQADTRAIACKTASSIGDIGAAVASLNTRLGLTGKPLRKLAKQFADFSRMTGGNAQQDVRLITRLFGDWGVETEKFGETLDMVFRTMQASDITAQELTGTVVQFGAPLRQLGFSLSETLAMLGQWEREGVNVSTVMTGLRRAVIKFGSEGIDARRGLIQMFEDVENAATNQQATFIASEILGKKAASDVAAAIREGRFEFKDTLKVIEGGTDTIAKAASDTESWSEKWQILKNRLMKKFEPLAMDVFKRIEKAGDWMIANSDSIAQFFTDAYKSAKPLLKIVGQIAEGLGEVAEMLLGQQISETQELLAKKFGSAWWSQLGGMLSLKGWDSTKLNQIKALRDSLNLDPSTITTIKGADKALKDLSAARLTVEALEAEGVFSQPEADQIIATIDALNKDATKKWLQFTKEAGKGGKQASRELRDPLGRPLEPLAAPKIEGAAKAARDARGEMMRELQKAIGIPVRIQLHIPTGTGLGEFGGGSGGGRLNPFRALTVARAQLGKPWVLGASGPSAFDCSGFVKYVYNHAGLPNFPTYTGNQWMLGKQVNSGQLLPGDQLFFRTGNSKYTDQFGWGHTGIYMGSGQYIHSSGRGTGVIISSLAGRSGYGARRHFARGGIVERPTPALIGEAGPEAVVPLSRNKRGRANQIMDEAGIGGNVIPVTVTIGTVVATNAAQAEATVGYITNRVVRELAQKMRRAS